jgi:flagellar hook-length control protein FliK
VKDNTTAEKSNESVNNKSVFNSRYDVKNGETSGDNDKEVLNSSTKADENQLKVSQEVDRQPETENSSKMEMSEENNQSKDGAEEEANIKESKGESFLSLIKNDNTVSKESAVFKSDIPQVNKENIIEQVAEKIKILVNDGNEGKQEVRIKLKPEILGELVLKVEVEKGVVIARAVVDNFRTKELLEMNINQLQEGLKEQGLDIKTFSVYVGNNSDFEKEGKNNFFSNKRNKKMKMKNVNLEGIGNYDASMFVENLSNTEVGKLDLMA